MVQIDKLTVVHLKAIPVGETEIFLFKKPVDGSLRVIQNAQSIAHRMKERFGWLLYTSIDKVNFALRITMVRRPDLENTTITSKAPER